MILAVRGQFSPGLTQNLPKSTTASGYGFIGTQHVVCLRKSYSIAILEDACPSRAMSALPARNRVFRRNAGNESWKLHPSWGSKGKKARWLDSVEGRLAGYPPERSAIWSDHHAADEWHRQGEAVWPRFSQAATLVVESKREARGVGVVARPNTHWLSGEMSQDQGRVETEGQADYHIGKYSFRGWLPRYRHNPPKW